ncbi:MAG TPA: PH domain-containing protein [Solimonas sp.]|nr:PH domain-containing protein [Solimonas sp.]
MDENETLVWEGSPSQWTNFPVFLLCLLIVPIPFALWKWLETRCFVYRVTTQRVVVRHGVFSKLTDELELYRVKDTALVEPFWLRLVGRGHVVLMTSDRSTPEMRLTAVPNAPVLREELRKHIERLRTAKGLRELDVGEVRP